MINTEVNKHWDTVITPKKKLLNFEFGEIWKYRDLLSLFVKKDIITVYKQTVLGPIWYFLQPILTTFVFMLLFGRIANIPTDGIPQFPFYLIGLTLWNFFSETLNTTSKTFTDNSALFGKVYFPRLIMPLSKVASGFIKFLIQFGFFIIVWGYCVYKFPAVTPNWYILLSPILLLLIVGIALAAGILVTSLTTKYRDLVFLITFVVQLLMYATPIAYSMSDPKLQKFSTLLWLNPLTSLFEAFKYCFFGKGVFSIPWLLYSLGFTVALFIIGLITFNKVEKHFIDTV